LPVAQYYNVVYNETNYGDFMSRFSVETSLNNPAAPSQQQPGVMPANWPTVFNKETIGIERNGIIVNHDRPILSAADIQPVPWALEGIREMRLKGYRVVIFFNEPLISEGKITPEQVDTTNNRLMEIFGQAGIMSIDGLLYSTTSMKQDIYSLPNTGMLKKAETDFRVRFKGGYFVGDKIHDLKAGDSVHATPVLIRSGQFGDTLEKLDTFANRELKAKTKVFNNLLEFATQLP
jgi:HAD superfamily hydrolase (TIGR01662 family)